VIIVTANVGLLLFEIGETRVYITDKMLNIAGVSWGRVSGFERHRNGAITTFDAPGVGTGPGQGTVSNANNSIGAMTGFYSDANFRTHGFLRTPDWHH
jgi:hypothetical protein